MNSRSILYLRKLEIYLISKIFLSFVMTSHSLDEFRILLLAMLKKNYFSEQFLSIYDNEINSLDYFSSESDSNSNSSSDFILGLEFYFLFNKFLQNILEKRQENETKVANIVSQFDQNEISDELARHELNELIAENQKIDVFFPTLKRLNDKMLFSPQRLAIDINATVGLTNSHVSETDTREIINLFRRYYFEYEKNVTFLETLKRTAPKDLQNFIANMINKIDSHEINIDFDSINSTEFDKELDLFFQHFFNSLSEININQLNLQFRPIIEGITLAEKNNKNYFFESQEKSTFSQLTTSRNQEGGPKSTDLPIKSDMVPQTYISSLKGNPWDIVGAIVLNPVHKGIGIAGFPYFTIKDNEVYISVKVEKEIDLGTIEELYHRVASIRINAISDNTQGRKNIMKTEIMETLEIPEELVFFPSIVLEFLSSIGINDFRTIMVETRHIEYYKCSEVLYEKEHHKVIIPDNVESKTNLEGAKLFTSASSGTASENKAISLSYGFEIGQISSEITFLGRGNYLILELDLPHANVLEKLLRRIRSVDDEANLNELWKLRFTIGKTIDVYEAEALLPTNIWKYIWTEKILLNPYDILSSFIGIVPSGAISLESLGKDSIHLSRGINYDPVHKYFENFHYTIKSVQGLTLGMSMGLKLYHKEPVLVYTPLTVSDILHKLGRDSSYQAQEKLSKRINKAFGRTVPKKFTLHVRNVLTYLLFYAMQFSYFIDFTDLDLTISWFEEEFEFKMIKLSSIQEIDDDTIVIKQ